MSRRVTGDRGLATVWMLGLAGLIASFTAAVALLAMAAALRGRAAAAADLAALAGARAITAPEASDACARAAAVAAANRARLDRCTVTGAVVTVDVSVRLPGALAALGGADRVTRHARAGPLTVRSA